MKNTFKIILSMTLAVCMLLVLSGCGAPQIVKNGDFSKEYKTFFKNMQKTLPVSVAYEQYFISQGFQKEKLITDTDSADIRELVATLAEVKITDTVENASNFAVKHYTFTNENGEKFTFEFYGEYLKCEDVFYKTENSLPFISIRLREQPSGSFLVALDEAHEGRGENAGKMYLAYREVKEQDGKFTKVSFGDCELSPDAKITAPVSHDDSKTVQTVPAADFFATFEQVKGQDNANYIFKAVIEKGVIVSLAYLN